MGRKIFTKVLYAPFQIIHLKLQLTQERLITAEVTRHKSERGNLTNNVTLYKLTKLTNEYVIRIGQTVYKIRTELEFYFGIFRDKSYSGGKLKNVERCVQSWKER